MWGFSLEDLAKRAQEEATKLAVRRSLVFFFALQQPVNNCATRNPCFVVVILHVHVLTVYSPVVIFPSVFVSIFIHKLCACRSKHRRLI